MMTIAIASFWTMLGGTLGFLAACLALGIVAGAAGGVLRLVFGRKQKPTREEFLAAARRRREAINRHPELNRDE